MTVQQLASSIAKQEGLKSQVSIGNVREILRLTLTTLAQWDEEDVIKLVKRYQRKGNTLRR